MSDFLVQTRVGSDIGEEVAKRAGASGESIAGWLRRLIMREVGSARIPAHVVRKDRADPRIHFAQGLVPGYYLEPVQYLSAVDRVFVLLHGEASGGIPGTPVLEGGLRRARFFEDPAGHRFLLEGSPQPWMLVTSVFDSANSRSELTLRALLDD